MDESKRGMNESVDVGMNEYMVKSVIELVSQ